jgi:RsmE family RNA methyltransferase
MKNLSSHQFAIHIPGLSQLVSNSGKSCKISLKDKNLAHRLFSVLRFEAQDKLIFFDRFKHVYVEIVSWSKNGEVFLDILEVKDNLVLTPKIIWLLPIFKRVALEEAIYSLSEIGVSSIQLVITEKSQQVNLDAKHIERLNSVIIAAAEQSKNFNYPEILSPIKLKDIKFQDNNTQKVYFDPEGRSALELLAKKTEIRTGIIAMCGPEGDLTQPEKDLLKSSLGFEFFALTQTVLRASQAVALGAGLLRLN